LYIENHYGNVQGGVRMSTPVARDTALHRLARAPPDSAPAGIPTLVLDSQGTPTLVPRPETAPEVIAALAEAGADLNARDDGGCERGKHN
jgi:hypothetical protein